MKRKILSLLLVVAVLASMVVLAPTAGAAESQATLEFGTAAGTAGEQVTVDFTITTANLTGLQFMFEYDASRLTYEGISWDAAESVYGRGNAADLTNGAASVFTKDGPYRVESWATGIGVGAVDLSAGVVMATLTFTINDDAPLGDAKVAFCTLNEGVVQPNKLVAVSGGDEWVAADMTFVDGKVTVLPEGYSTESVAPVVNYLSQDDVDNGVITYAFDETGNGVIITGYTANTYSGIVVLPSVINDTMVEFMFEDYPVVGVATEAFNSDSAATAFVIPESVTEIATAAFFKCAATDYYVMNDDCVIGTAAMGATGNIPNSKFYIYNKTLVAGTTVSTTTIHGGASAQTYANTTFAAVNAYPATCFSYVADTAFPTENKVTFDGNSYFALTGSTIPAPGVGKIGGATVIGWSDGVNSYAPGADITVTADLALEPITIAAPATSNAVDFKLTANEADLAMRFTSNLSIADYNKLAALGTVSFGMLITPAAYVAKAGAFTKEALNTIGAVNGAYVDIAIGGYYQKTNTDYIFAGSLKGFSAKTLAKNPDFASVLYVNVKTAAGDVFTVYGDFNFEANQNVKGVATALSTSNALTDTQKEWLVTLVGKFTV